MANIIAIQSQIMSSTIIQRFLAVAVISLLGACGGASVERWQTLPPTPTLPAGGQSAYVNVNGAHLYYTVTGHGSPVIFLHGGPANSQYLGNQVAALQATHQVISLDTRGHGRSTRDATPLSYDQFADDVIGLMNALNIQRADVFGWSDGGITGIDIAMRYPDRIGRLVAFGANTNTAGATPDLASRPVWIEFIKRAAIEYAALSPTPQGFDDLSNALNAMYQTMPNWSDAQLQTIRAPVLIMDGDHDEAVKLEHAHYMAQTIPGAQLVIIPDASHFAFLQAPDLFNSELQKFLN